MKPSIAQRLEGLKDRHEELAALLADPQTLAEPTRFKRLSIEYSQLQALVDAYRSYRDCQQELTEAEALATDPDPELRALAADDLPGLRQRLAQLDQALQALLLPQDPHDGANIFLEVRAGTGGDEAALFAGDLFRMYSRYAEAHRWPVEVLSVSEGEHGGYKEIIARIEGAGAYARLKFESGAHRVQRVPDTESQGRIHTSAATVAVMPEVADIDAVDINPGDLKVDTFRASGAGGQHVNKTDSAIRITHLPSGTVVECQEERSQHKNRARAMALLAARLLDARRETQQREQAQTRRLLVGSGDRSERIRTYNYPQGRVTDHRINLTLYKLDEVMAGGLDAVIEPLIREDQAERLAALQSAEF